MRVKVLRNLGKADESLPKEIRDLDLKENEVHDLPEPLATVLLEKKLAEADAPKVMRSTLVPENPEAVKARAAHEQAQREAMAQPEAAAFGHVGPVERVEAEPPTKEHHKKK